MQQSIVPLTGDGVTPLIDTAALTSAFIVLHDAIAASVLIGRERLGPDRKEAEPGPDSTLRLVGPLCPETGPQQCQLNREF